MPFIKIMIKYSELKAIGKVVAYFKVPSGGTEENHEIYQSDC